MSLNKLKNSGLVKKIRSEFSKDAVVAGTVKLASGNLIGQAINFIASPILSRLYDEDVFGIYTIFVSILFIAGTLMMGQYDQAIPVESEFSGTKSLMKLCRHISYIFTPLLMVGSFLYINWQGIYDNPTEMIGFVAAITLSGYCQTVANRQGKVLIKYKKYKAQSISMILYTSSYVLAALTLKLVDDSINALIYAYCISEIVTCVVRTISVNRIEGWSEPYKNCEKEMMIKHSRFPRYTVASTFLNSFSTNMPSLVITNLFGTALAGVFGMANKIVGIPFSLISTSVSSVFYQEASNLYNKSEDVSNIGNSSMRKLTALSVIPMTALMALGDILFRIVLGAQWEESGRVCQMLAIWMSVVFVVSPLMSIYNIKQKQYVTIFINLALLLFRAGALFLGGLIIKDFSKAMLLYSIAGVAVWVVVYTMVSREIKLNLKSNALYFLKLYIPCIAAMIGLRYLLLLIF